MLKFWEIAKKISEILCDAWDQNALKESNILNNKLRAAQTWRCSSVGHENFRENIDRVSQKRCQKLFISQYRKNSRKRPFWCFWKFLVSKKNMHKTKHKNFPSKVFWTHSIENFEKGTFWCFWLLARLVTDCTCMLWDNVPGERVWEKVKNS